LTLQAQAGYNINEFGNKRYADIGILKRHYYKKKCMGFGVRFFLK
jgi:hypothetical protein